MSAAASRYMKQAAHRLQALDDTLALVHGMVPRSFRTKPLRSRRLSKRPQCAPATLPEG